MAAEDPSLRTYRRVVAALVLVAALIAAGVGVRFLWHGEVFKGFLALCAVGLFVLIAYGYRQDEEERNPRR